MKFRYVIAEHRCTRCPGGRSDYAISLSAPYFVLALVAASAWCVRGAVSLPAFSWLDALAVYGAQLLALFAAGWPFSMVESVLDRSTCGLCGGFLSLRGRHFASSRRPRRSDVALAVVFVVLNVAAWSASTA